MLAAMRRMAPITTIGAAFALIISLTSDRVMLSLVPTTRGPAIAEASLLASAAFAENAGQFAPEVAFARPYSGMGLFVLADGRLIHTFDMSEASEPPVAAGAARSPKHVARERSTSGWVVVESLLGAASPSLEGEFEVDSVSWFTGSGRARTFETIRLHEPWPGIDMRLRFVAGESERLFEVAPGADASAIRLGFEGVKQWELRATGEVIFHTGAGPLTLSAPRAYQETPHGRQPVGVSYRVQDHPLSVSFVLGSYDDSLPLIIDPVLQATYFGSTAFDAAIITQLAVDPTDGDLYVAGAARSNNLPALEGGYQVLHQQLAAFVARLDPTLRRAKQTTLFGGFSDESVRGLAIHPATGEVYIGGDTLSPDLPATGGGAEPHMNFGGVDGFIARFSEDLRTLEQTTYFGGRRGPIPLRALAVNPVNGELVAIGNGLLIARFNPELTHRLFQRTLIGEISSIRGTSVAINSSSGDIYVGGLTRARELPRLAGGARTSISPPEFGESAFVAQFDAELTTHRQSTYVFDVPAGFLLFNFLAIDPLSGDVYSVGHADASPGLPVLNAAQPASAGNVDGFAVRLSPDLTRVVGATYFGGTSEEQILGIAPTRTGDSLYIMGTTFSPNLPGTAGGAVPPDGDLLSPDAFVTRLSADLSAILQTSYFTGSGDVRGGAIAIHPDTDEVYLGGFQGFEIPEISGALQEQRGDAFIARFDASLRGFVDTDPDAFSFVDHSGVAPGSTVTSAPVRIEGIIVSTPVSISGGEFSVAQGPFQSAAATILRGQSVRVRHASAAGPALATSSVLTIGSRTATFTSTTASGTDTTPNAFSFPPLNPAVPDILVISDPIVVTGLDTPASIAIAGGEYSLDAGAFTSAAGSVHTGQSLRVRQRTSAQFGIATDSIVSIGGVSGTFRTITDPVDSVPHVFNFRDQIDRDANTEVVSAPVTVDGINVPVPISIAGGEYSIREQPFTTATGTINAFDYFTVRVRTGALGTSATATVTIGGVSDQFNAATPEVGDGVPDPFDFADMTVPPDGHNGRFVLSNQVVISGIDIATPITTDSGTFFDPDIGLYTNRGKVRNGQAVQLRLFSPFGPGDLYTVTVTIGGVRDTLRVRGAGGDLTADPFNFVDQTNVAAGTQVVSNVVAISGIVGSVDVTVTTCELSVNFNDFSSAPTMIRNGDQLRVRVTALAGPGQSTSCTVNVGGVTDQFRVTNAGGNSGGGGGGSGGGGPVDLLALLALAAAMRRRRCELAGLG